MAKIRYVLFEYMGQWFDGILVKIYFSLGFEDACALKREMRTNGSIFGWCPLTLMS